VELKKYFMTNQYFELTLFLKAAYLDPSTFERLSLVDRSLARQSLMLLLQDSFSNAEEAERLPTPSCRSEVEHYGYNQDSLFQSFLDRTGFKTVGHF
jgi:hypothetical protein